MTDKAKKQRTIKPVTFAGWVLVNSYNQILTDQLFETRKGAVESRLHPSEKAVKCSITVKVQS
jgi:hypothetical protein